jgi:hypothetical protein
LFSQQERCYVSINQFNLLKLDGLSWADTLNAAGKSVWALDFAGFGGSELYPKMTQANPAAGEPLGRAPEAAEQIDRGRPYHNR